MSAKAAVAAWATVLWVVCPAVTLAQAAAPRPLVTAPAAPGAGAADDVARLGPVVPGAARSRITTGEVATVAAAVALYAGSLGLPDAQPLGCGPCPRSEIPSFDRWAVTLPHQAWDIGSTVALGVLAGATWADVLRHDDPGLPRLREAVESAGVAYAATAFLKGLVHRRRPYVFAAAPGSLTAGQLNEAQQGWPSAHAAAAAAVATDYLLARGRNAPTTVRMVVIAAAGSIAAMRVAAGWHFPSDVASGAVLGAGSALLVHVVRF